MQLYQLALVMGMLAVALVAVIVFALRSTGDQKAARRTAQVTQASPRTAPNATFAEAAVEDGERLVERRRKLPMLSETEAAERTSADTNGVSFSEDIFSKLEQAFEAYQRQSVSLETYSSLVVAEQQAVERHIHGLRAQLGRQEPTEQEAADLADAESAREAVRWCIDWAYEQARDRRTANG